ncbi:class I SAM-dependent methyltransferase [Cellulomonas soli]|uniref:Methyltransferase n=1 Tax=Cellulomonas soli TaxID=931535 RepID=A0A512PDG7_9CELL|nr:class I SAM-dependent methyltransferase [Cellulomonas soli]NYI60089.1 SAM-dependent methyltransferase [Cellulomonas soli]GEP69257.1 methyltransferase [Cellulomonas soli]
MTHTHGAASPALTTNDTPGSAAGSSDGEGRDGAVSEAEHWEAFYRASDRHWSGRVNVTLADRVADLHPGSALDLGCGEGADAVWLADHGWQVTAVDVSATALERGRRHAADAGVADRIIWERHDLARTFPAGQFDLVSAQFLHSSLRRDRSPLLRSATGSVAPGGTLLLVSHGAFPDWAPEPRPDVVFHTASETVDLLRLDPEEWEVVAATTVERDAATPDGATGRLEDVVVQVRRRGPLDRR